MSKKFWQIASGEKRREFTDLFLAHDVMFLGPSRFGPYDEHTYSSAIDSGLLKKSRKGMIRSFTQKVQPGDIVLLRFGYKVVSVGLVANDEYQHNKTFDDIHGWDLEHTRRVIWQDHLTSELKRIQRKSLLFAGRKQIPAFTKVKHSDVLDPIRHLVPKCKERILKRLPPTPAPILTLDDFCQGLFESGLAFDAVEKARTAMKKQQEMLDWYRNSGLADKRPSEHEIVAHLVLPMMQALGWSEQQLAIEWHKIDLAAFLRPPTDEKSCVLICEAKKFKHGLQNVVAQAVEYRKSLKLKACNTILLTNGGRYYVYTKTGRSWSEHPTGYMNVLKLRREHIRPKDTDAVETLISLTPSKLGR